MLWIILSSLLFSGLIMAAAADHDYVFNEGREWHVAISCSLGLCQAVVFWWMLVLLDEVTSGTDWPCLPVVQYLFPSPTCKEAVFLKMLGIGVFAGQMLASMTIHTSVPLALSVCISTWHIFFNLFSALIAWPLATTCAIAHSCLERRRQLRAQAAKTIVRDAEAEEEVEANPGLMSILVTVSVQHVLPMLESSHNKQILAIDCYTMGGEHLLRTRVHAQATQSELYEEVVRQVCIDGSASKCNIVLFDTDGGRLSQTSTAEVSRLSRVAAKTSTVPHSLQQTGPRAVVLGTKISTHV
jgi:hypothetical protein